MGKALRKGLVVRTKQYFVTFPLKLSQKSGLDRSFLGAIAGVLFRNGRVTMIKLISARFPSQSAPSPFGERVNGKFDRAD